MIHPVPPGLYCVPSAVCALTGEDPTSVVLPALNRAAHRCSLLADPGPTLVSDALVALAELGYVARRARSTLVHHRVRWWTERAVKRRYASPLLLAVRRHAVVAWAGLVVDNHVPAGCLPAEHPFGNAVVVDAWLVLPR